MSIKSETLQRSTTTLTHVVRFKSSKLRQYETALRNVPECQVHWPALDLGGGRLDQLSRLEQLQLADLCASAVFRAFEPDNFREHRTSLPRRVGGTFVPTGYSATDVVRLEDPPYKRQGRLPVGGGPVGEATGCTAQRVLMFPTSRRSSSPVMLQNSNDGTTSELRFYPLSV